MGKATSCMGFSCEMEDGTQSRARKRAVWEVKGRDCGSWEPLSLLSLIPPCGIHLWFISWGWRLGSPALAHPLQKNHGPLYGYYEGKHALGCRGASLLAHWRQPNAAPRPCPALPAHSLSGGSPPPWLPKQLLVTWKGNWKSDSKKNFVYSEIKGPKKY